MRRVSALLMGLMMTVSFGVGDLAALAGSFAGGDAALQKLMDGNKRYVEERLLHPNQTVERRMELTKGQHPFAAIISCADSRVPPEIVFDQGLGDLFAVRLAGNIVDDAALASLEYAVKYLGVRCIMVLGHTRCGAVEAAVKGGEAPGHIGCLVKAIQPAVDMTKDAPGDPVDNAVRAHIALVVQQLKTSPPILEESVRKGDLTVVGACYDLADGVVTVLP